MKPLLVCIGVTTAMWILAGAGNRRSRDKAEDRERRVVLQPQLESEADRIQDVRDLKRLQRAYGYYIDCGMWS